MKRILMKTVGISFVFFMMATSLTAQISNEELIKKHLESIGKAEDISKASTRVFTGKGKITSRLYATNSLDGAVQFGSTNDKSVFAMVFNYNDYPYEKAAFDGKKITVGKPLGRRTPVAEFLRTQGAVLKQGLFGGVLNSYWPLLQAKERNIKIDVNGKGDWEGISVYKVKFLSKTGGLSITLFFDDRDFRHVGSEYKYTIPPRQGGMTSNAGQLPSHFTLKETFSNFKTVNGLTLPFNYKLEIDNTGSARVGTGLQGAQQWTIEYTNALFDQELGSEVFSVS